MPISRKAASLLLGMHPCIAMTIIVAMPLTNHLAFPNLHSAVPQDACSLQGSGTVYCVDAAGSDVCTWGSVGSKSKHHSACVL